MKWSHRKKRGKYAADDRKWNPVSPPWLTAKGGSASENILLKHYVSVPVTHAAMFWTIIFSKDWIVLQRSFWKDSTLFSVQRHQLLPWLPKPHSSAQYLAQLLQSKSLNPVSLVEDFTLINRICASFSEGASTFLPTSWILQEANTGSTQMRKSLLCRARKALNFRGLWFNQKQHYFKASLIYVHLQYTSLLMAHTKMEQ